jgi:hypothetical protein
MPEYPLCQAVILAGISIQSFFAKIKPEAVALPY